MTKILKPTIKEEENMKREITTITINMLRWEVGGTKLKTVTKK